MNSQQSILILTIDFDCCFPSASKSAYAKYKNRKDATLKRFNGQKPYKRLLFKLIYGDSSF
jgi:hypothetical protein